MDTVGEINIHPITEEEFESFHACLDSMARERKFLGSVQAPPLEKTRDWLQAEMEEGAIRLVALDDSRVVGEHSLDGVYDDIIVMALLFDQ